MKAIGHHIIQFLENWHQNRIRNHIGFWLFNILVFFCFEFLYGNDLWEASINKFFTLPVLILNSYYLAYYLVPLLMRKSYVRLILGFLIGSYVFAVSYRYIMVYWIERFTHPELEKDSFLNLLTNFSAILNQYLILIYVTPLFFILLKSAKDAFVIKRKLLQLQKEKQITDLNFLRSQVHPHFLFNTLNNIYVLALKNDKRTSSVVKQLGDMMEYMVESSSTTMVPIQKEIDLILNYLDLERIRYEERLDLSFTYEIDNEHTKIAPLMLMSFIENAFKHGVSGDVNKPVVKVSLIVKDGVLDFRIYNTKSEQKQLDEKSFKKGIGVSNVKRQLDIIYQNDYILDIEESLTEYKVSLKLLRMVEIIESHKSIIQ